jgi:predicted Zn-dependent peptidase
MKKIIQSIIVLMVLPAVTIAQQGKPYDMMINGVKVIVQPSGNDIVVVQTVVKGGVQNYPAAKAGIEALAISALTECGTANDDKNSFKNKLDNLGAQVYGNSQMDYANFTMNVIKNDFEQAWRLYTDALTKPRFDAKEFNRIKQDQINLIRNDESNPDAALDKMARQTAFAGKAYSKEPSGTVETVSKLTSEETKSYWKNLLTRSRMVIVIVGDLDKSTIEEKVKVLTATIPQGTPYNLKKESYMPTANSFKPMKRDNATNYIQGIAAAPLPGSKDYNAFNLAMRLFSQRHFLDVRSKNGLSYAPGAWFSGGTTPYANIYVTTTQPNNYIAVARALIDTIRQKGFTADELKNIKTQYLTGFYYTQETNAAQANTLAVNEVIHGNWKRA